MNGNFRRYFIFTLHFIPLILVVALVNWAQNRDIENRAKAMEFLYSGYYIGCVEMGVRWNEENFISYCKDSTTVFKNRLKEILGEIK